MQDSLQNIRDYNEKESLRNERDIKHAALLDSNTQTQQVIVSVMKGLVDYLDNRISKTEVVNQLEQIGTPDAYKVVEAVNALNNTIESQEKVDLTEITTLLNAVLNEAKQIPKSHKDIEIPKPIDNTKQLQSLESAIKAVDKSIKAQKLIAEAPVVNVPETVINVEKPDLSPIEKELQASRTELVAAVKDIVIPETDVTTVEKELKKLNKLFNEFLDSVPGGGGGGAPRATPYSDSNDVPTFVELESDGSIPVTVVAGGSGSVANANNIFMREDSGDSNIIYVGEAANGTATSAAEWKVTKLDTTYVLDVTYADGNLSYDNIWDNRESLSYS